MEMARDATRQYCGRKCFYCTSEAKNITIDDEGVMFYLCEKHFKLFKAHNPKGIYDKNKCEEWER